MVHKSNFPSIARYGAKLPFFKSPPCAVCPAQSATDVTISDAALGLPKTIYTDLRLRSGLDLSRCFEAGHFIYPRPWAALYNLSDCKFP
jgi:hypothetical protein